MIGVGTPREFSARASTHLMLLTIAADTLIGILIVASNAKAEMLAVSFEPGPSG